MGISNVAVKTFDSTGSQSLCRTNEYSGDEEVKSSFISKCQKLYISGSGETVIPGSLRTFPTLNSTDTFYVNSDTDAISDITLNIEFKLKQATGVAANWHASVSKDIILGLIDKVEIKTGSLTVQTLTADDIYIRNLTELGQPFTFSAPFELIASSHVDGDGITDIARAYKSTPSKNIWKSAAYSSDVITIQAACSIPFIGRSNDMSRSLLQAGALTNAVTVKVYYNNIYINNSSPTVGSHYQILSAGNGSENPDGVQYVSSTSGDFLDTAYFKSNIKVRTHIVSETEKKFISKNIIHKVLNTSTNVTKEIPRDTTITNLKEGVTEIEVDLENVSLNVSHLLIGIRLPHVKNKTLSVRSDLTIPPGSSVNRLFSDSHHTNWYYPFDFTTPFSVINTQFFYGANLFNSAKANLFGYMPDAIESMELVIGSDRTGFINGASAKIGTCENFYLVNNDKNSAHYIINLAEKAFDTAGVPFSKTNNKKLLIKLNKHIFKNGGGITKNSLSSDTYSQNAIITVTACGTQVQSVVGGSMSFL